MQQFQIDFLSLHNTSETHLSALAGSSRLWLHLRIAWELFKDTHDQAVRLRPNECKSPGLGSQHQYFLVALQMLLV